MISRIATSKLMVNNKGLRSITSLCRAIGSIITAIFFLFILGTSIQAQTATANITIGVVTVPETSTGTVTASLTNAESGLSDFQGTMTFDSTVVRVRDVSGLNGYTIAAFQIDNFEGQVRFIGYKSSGDLITEGDFIQFTLESAGQVNDSSILNMEFITFNNESGPITHIVTPGRFTIGARTPLSAEITYSPSVPEINQEIQFTGAASGGSESYSSWLWDFGDETTSSEQNPAHTYSAPGNFNVSLTVTDSLGTEATTEQTITILPPGGADQITVHNYPNPASSSTTFSYYVPIDSTEARLSVYAFTGPLVFSQAIDVQAIEYTWNLRDNNGNDIPSGAYLYRIWASTPEGPRISQVGKLVIQR